MSDIIVRVGIIAIVMYLIFKGYKWFTSKNDDDIFKGDD